jgi:ABC-2 type transport system ATP-binding protein
LAELVLTGAGGAVTRTAPDTLTVAGLPAEVIIAVLNRHQLTFSEVAAHRATLEDAYLELTREAVEFRPAAPELTR